MYSDRQNMPQASKLRPTEQGPADHDSMSLTIPCSNDRAIAVRTAVEAMFSWNPIKANLAYRALKNETNLQAAFELSAVYPRAGIGLGRRMDDLFHQITRENNDPLEILGSSPVRRIKSISEIINKHAWPVLRSEFPQSRLVVFDIGASSGRVALGVAKGLQAKLFTYHITDLVSCYTELRDRRGNSAIFCDAVAAPLQLLTHNDLIRFRHGGKEADQPLNRELVETLHSLSEAHALRAAGEKLSPGFWARTMSAFCPGVERETQRSDSKIVKTGPLDIWKERPSSAWGHLSVCSSLVEPGYMDLGTIMGALKALGQNTHPRGLVLIINETEHGDIYDGPYWQSHFSLFQRQGDRLMLMEKSSGLDTSCGGFTDAKPWIKGDHAQVLIREVPLV